MHQKMQFNKIRILTKFHFLREFVAKHFFAFFRVAVRTPLGHSATVALVLERGLFYPPKSDPFFDPKGGSLKEGEK